MLIIAGTTNSKSKSGASKKSSDDILISGRSRQTTNSRGTSSSQTARRSTAQTTSRSTSQPQRKPTTSAKRRKKKKSSDSGAKAFLFLMLLAVAVFVAVVCIKGADSDTLSTTETTVSPSQDITDGNNSTDGNDDLPVQGQVNNNGDTDTGDDNTTQEDKPSFYNPATVTDCSFDTVVVNRNYRIPESYEDTLELVYVCGSNQRLQKDVAVQYEAMYSAALEDGIYLTPCSGYRSYDTQVSLYNNKVNQKLNEGYSEDEAPIQAATVVMVPGSSEHNLGYAMDIVCVEEWFEETDEFAWLMENAEDYGFILRYPEDKQDVTMVIYEPWHWRYVGVDAAKAINASGLTLEEYYGKSAQ